MIFHGTSATNQASRCIYSMSGHRVISSRGGHFYSATKYAVTALTEGVRNELREVKSHIRVSVSKALTDTSSIRPISQISQ